MLGPGPAPDEPLEGMLAEARLPPLLQAVLRESGEVFPQNTTTTQHR